MKDKVKEKLNEIKVYYPSVFMGKCFNFVKLDSSKEDLYFPYVVNLIASVEIVKKWKVFEFEIKEAKEDGQGLTLEELTFTDRRLRQVHLQMRVAIKEDFDKKNKLRKLLEFEAVLKREKTEETHPEFSSIITDEDLTRISKKLGGINPSEELILDLGRMKYKQTLNYPTQSNSLQEFLNRVTIIARSI